MVNDIRLCRNCKDFTECKNKKHKITGNKLIFCTNKNNEKNV